MGKVEIVDLKKAFFFEIWVFAFWFGFIWRIVY